MAPGIWYIIAGLVIGILALAFSIKVFKYLCNAKKITNDKSKHRQRVFTAFNILLALTIFNVVNSGVSTFVFPNALAMRGGGESGGRGGRGRRGGMFGVGGGGGGKKGGGGRGGGGRGLDVQSLNSTAPTTGSDGSDGKDGRDKDDIKR